MKFVIYLDASDYWRWKLIAANGENIANGSEGYVTKGNAKRAVRRMKTAVLFADIVIE